MTDHSVYGASAPATPSGFTVANDGSSVQIVNSFYVVGVTGWRMKGVRLYLPSGSTLIGQSIVLRAWAPAVASSALNGTPTATTTITGVAGWNEFTFTPVTVSPSSSFYKFAASYATASGDYQYAAGSTVSPWSQFTQASDGAPLYLSESSNDANFTPQGRGSFRYGSGGNGAFDLMAGLDVIVDNGGASVTAAFTGSGTLSAAVNVTPQRVAAFSAIGTLSSTARLSIAQENALTGNGSGEYTIGGAGDTTNLGFCREFSVNAGNSAHFSCSGTGTVLDIYRIGYYGGLGWRKVTTLTNTATTQPTPNTITNSNGGINCTNWSTTATWDIPESTVSGLYVGVLRNAALNNASWIPFVVRNDTAAADIVIKLSDTTWALAYNYFGGMSAPLAGKSLYGSGGALGDITTRAHAASYHKPIVTRGGVDQTYFMACEAPMIRWAERMGYNVKYVASKDFDQIGATVAYGAKIVVSSGHDEYWSQNMRDAFATLRNSGTHLMFQSANEVFWRTRFTDSDTMWCYKDTMAGPSTHAAGVALDPVTWTGTWKDTRSGNASTRAAENTITGTDFRMNGVNDKTAAFATNTYEAHPVWRNSTYASGTAFTVAGLVGFEADSYLPTSPGAVRLSGTSINIDGLYADNNGENYNGNGTLDWGIAAQRYSSGAVVIGMGTCQWSWGLDAVHDRGSNVANLNIQQFEYNLLRDLGADAFTPHTGIVTSGPVSLSNYGAASAIPTVLAPFAGGGALTATTSFTIGNYRSADFNGTGTLSATSSVVAFVAAPFTGLGGLSTTSFKVEFRPAGFTASGTATATVHVTFPLPSNSGVGMVKGKFAMAILTAPDADGIADLEPQTGTITFAPSAAVILNATATPDPIVITPTPVVCHLDSEGYLLGAKTAERLVRLLATDDPDHVPLNWRWVVSFQIPGATIPSFSLAVPADTTTDLATKIPT